MPNVRLPAADLIPFATELSLNLAAAHEQIAGSKHVTYSDF